MKTQKIIYWGTTGLLSLAMLASSFMYLTLNPELVAGFTKMGYPLFLITLLGVAKGLGVVGLWVPGFPKVREWAYAGYSFNMIGAIWSHIAVGEPFVGPLLFLVLVGVSYYFNSKVNQTAQV